MFSFNDHINTLRPRQNGRQFADEILKCIFLNENVWIPIKFSLKFVPKGPINIIPALVQIMAWCHPDDKPLSEPTMLISITHICVTRPQWVKISTAVQIARVSNTKIGMRESDEPIVTYIHNKILYSRLHDMALYDCIIQGWDYGTFHITLKTLYQYGNALPNSELEWNVIL